MKRKCFRKRKWDSLNIRILVDLPRKKVVLYEGIAYDVARVFRPRLNAFEWMVTSITDRGADRLWNALGTPPAVQKYIRLLEGSSP